MNFSLISIQNKKQTHIYKYDDSLNNKSSHYLFSQSDYLYTPNPFPIIRVDPVKIIVDTSYQCFRHNFCAAIG